VPIFPRSAQRDPTLAAKGTDVLRFPGSLGFLLAIVAAVGVYSDAQKLRARGVRLSPGLWAVLVFMLAMLALPLYLILRFTVWQRQIDAARRLHGSRPIGSPLSVVPEREVAALPFSPLEAPTEKAPVEVEEPTADVPSALPAEAHIGEAQPSVSEATGQPVLAEQEIPPVLPVLPDPRFGRAVGWCFLVFVVQLFIGFCLGIGLAAFGQKPDKVFLLIVSSAIADVVLILLAVLALGSEVRRALALRNARPLHLLLALLLVPPALVVSEEISTRASQGLEAVFGEDQSGAMGGPDRSQRPTDTTAYLKWMDEWELRLAQQPWLVVLFVGCILPGLGEEVFFRGLLGRGLVAHYGVVPGILLTSLLFGLMHIDPVKVAYTTVLGVLLHVVYLNAKSLWPPILLHVLNNCLAFSKAKLILNGTIDAAATEDPLPIYLIATAALAIIAFGILYYRTRVYWTMADGNAWSPGYLTAETPASATGAAPRQAVSGVKTSLALSVTYAVFGAALAVTTTAWADPHTASAYMKRGNEALDRDDYGAALADFTEATRLDPKNSTAYAMRGEARRVRQEYTEAIADCEHAIELNPQNAMAYACRGAALYTLNKPDKALADYNKAIQLKPDFAWPYALRAWVYKARGEYKPAIADWTKAGELEPQAAENYRLLAWLRATCPEAVHRNGAKAVEYATKACELTNWQDADCLLPLAAAHAESGRFDEAVKWQERAMELAPGRAGHTYLLELYRSRRPYREERPSPTP
jgi:membrane protease YdiL (CAAX protease family)/tetratricopeptide (TPR) repeat protein